MTTIDSDDSLSDHGGYTETNVLLGYASKEPTNDTINQLGGQPNFLSSAHPPPASFSTCKVCSSHLSLLLQLNGDLPERFPDNERRLYLFACRKKQCMRKVGSIRGYRETRRWRDSQTKPEKKSHENGSAQTPPPVQATETSPEPAWRCGNMMPEMFTRAGGGDVGGLVFNSSGPFVKPLGAVGNSNPFFMSNSSNTRAHPPNNRFGSPQTTSASSNRTGPSPNGSTNPTIQTESLSHDLPPPSILAAKSPQPPSPSESQDQSTSNPTHQAMPSLLAESFASKLQISTSPPLPPAPQVIAPRPPLSSFLPPYPTYYLDADYETLDSDPSRSPATSSQLTSSKYDSEDTANSNATTTDKSTLLDSSMDVTFQRFSDRLAQNPEQVLRYEFGGQPLLYSSSDAVASRFPSGVAPKMPSCEHCGGRRVFELQLVPGVIAALEEEEGEGEGEGRGEIGIEEGMEWGTVILGVCERDCGAESEIEKTMKEVEGEVEEERERKSVWREEWVGVQWEERVVRK